MENDLLRGEKMRLTVLDFDNDFPLFERWSRNDEYARLLDFGPIGLFSADEMKEWHEKNSDDVYMFIIRRLEDDAPIGFVDLSGFNRINHDAWVGIGIGDPDCWSQGYGADAMRVLLRYAFTELNLHRVNLDVFADNVRGIRSYEKAGFVQEGRLRQFTRRDGQRWDIVFMGILRSDWEAQKERS